VSGCHVALFEAEPFPSLADSIRSGGGVLCDAEAADAVVWADAGGVDRLGAVLAANPSIRWVQLPVAGVERFVPLIDTDRQWTSGKGLYDEPVAELALALLLTGQRGIIPYARAHSWTEPQGRGLYGARLTVLGGGGITGALLRLLHPFEPDVTVVRRRPRPMAGVRRVVGPEELEAAVTGADGVVVALALTPETEGIIAAGELGGDGDGGVPRQRGPGPTRRDRRPGGGPGIGRDRRRRTRRHRPRAVAGESPPLVAPQLSRHPPRRRVRTEGHGRAGRPGHRKRPALLYR
jgi:hypothetical protein